jgi:hypothetical protein
MQAQAKIFGNADQVAAGIAIDIAADIDQTTASIRDCNES